MVSVLTLNKLQLELLCYQKQLGYLVPTIRELKETQVENKLVEIFNKIGTLELRVCEELWRGWYKLLHSRIEEIPTINKTYYFPGYCFQRCHRDIWNQGFEFRYARRVSVRTYLHCIAKFNTLHEINISSDISSYILSFLLPQQLGREIEVREFNSNITKKKDYLETTSRINQCRVGHRPYGPITCAKCNELTSIYMYVDLRLSTSYQDDYYLDEYQDNNQFTDDITLPRRRLELDLMNIKHSVKMSRLKYRAIKRLDLFQTC
jgi:hypothetical protein